MSEISVKLQKQSNVSQKTFLKSFLLVGSALSSVALPNMAFAQDAPVQTTAADQVQADDEQVLERVVVEGLRATIQGANEIKRTNTSIVDGLSSDDIDSLPALSIAEALETIASVASQREGSGATEVSIRGLGPFLGSTVINGREATNGSGDRSVNFSQFPSELFNKIEIYKTQEASLIEGGVAGQISLSTLKPLDHNKRRVQLQAKFNVNPQNLQVDNAARDFGYRLTGSYVDQFDIGPLGRFGLSIGGQTNITPNPEQEARSSSTFDACILAGLDSSSCDGSFPNLEGNELIGLDGQPITDRLGASEPFVLASSSRSFRQNITDDERNAVFGAIQWQPNDRIDFNFDVEYSDRVFSEFRSDIIFDSNDILEVDLDVAPVQNADGTLTFATAADDLDDEIFALTINPDGSLRTATTTGDIEANSQFSERLEEYVGFGGNLSYDVTDRLSVSVDGAYSDTSRVENQLQARVVTGGTTLIGIEVQQNGSDAQQFTVVNQDVTDPSNFTDDNTRVREDLNQFLNHTIWSVKGDLDYDVSDTLPFLSALKAGVRYSELEFDRIPRIRNEFEFDNTDVNGDPESDEFVTEINGVAVDGGNIATTAAQTCANGIFPESNFLNDEVNGNLITNIDEDGNVLEAGTGNTFLTFNGFCLGETLLGRELAAPSLADIETSDPQQFATSLIAATDLREETIAGYFQADYDTELGGFPVRGNLGLRVVHTDVTSIGFTAPLVTVTDDEGNITGIEADGAVDADGNINLVTTEAGNSYTEFLPSFNFVGELKDDLLVRGAVFRALSRPDLADFSAGRQFGSIDDGDTVDDLGESTADVLANVTALGNPELDPFLSWNFDAAVEWYPNDDTVVALGVYYKVFDGGFENIAQIETFDVDGQDFDVVVPVQNISDETNTIFGIEATVSHAFTYLPFPLDGFGFRGSYNYADSNFEFEDGRFGDGINIDANGVATDLTGFIPPANLVGLSEHTANGQIYYNIGKLSLQGIVKYRSDFFQQFNLTPLNLRFIDDSTVFEARIRYKLSDNVKISLEGVNLFNESRDQFNPTLDNFAEINVFGPRYFVGITAKF